MMFARLHLKFAVGVAIGAAIGAIVGMVPILGALDESPKSKAVNRMQFGWIDPTNKR